MEKKDGYTRSENYTFKILDFSKIPKKVKPKMNNYEIWLGWYHLGQGSHPPTEPNRVGVVKATSFKIACVIYEHQKAIDSLKSRMERGDTYIEDIHFGGWCYDAKSNSNSWTGKYYETKEKAMESINNRG